MDLPPICTAVYGSLAHDSTVSALWIGGSHARGDADEFSDVDLAINAPNDWSPTSLGESWVAGQSMNLGGNPFYHGILSDGTILDLLVTSSPWEGYVPVDLTAFAMARSTTSISPESQLSGPAVDFWISTHKDRKVFGRGLGAMLVFGLHHHRLSLLRMWTIEATGVDPGPSAFTIHGMTPIIREYVTPERERLLGLPCRDSREAVDAVRLYRAEISRSGRAALEMHGYEYPFRLENIVMSFPLEHACVLPDA